MSQFEKLVLEGLILIVNIIMFNPRLSNSYAEAFAQKYRQQVKDYIKSKENNK